MSKPCVFYFSLTVILTIDRIIIN